MGVFEILLKRGLRADLPASAPSGEPFYCTDTNELFIGTGSGMAAAVASPTVAEIFATMAVAAETARAEAAEALLASSSSLTAEITRAEAAETTLQTNITSEASTRSTADGVLAAAITTETSRATAAEATKAAVTYVDSEDASHLVTAETYTDSSIATEVTNRNTAIAVETSRATAAEATKAATSYVDSADTSHLATAEAYTDSSVSTEVTNRNAAIAVETSRATTAEGLLTPLASPTLTGVASVKDDNIGNQGSGNTPVSALIVKNTTAAVTGAGNMQDPPTIEQQGQYWDGSATQTGSTKQVTHFGTGASFNWTVLMTGLASIAYSVAFKIAALATNVLNIAAPAFSFLGSYWNGSAGAQDTWKFNPSIGAGTNPTSTFAVQHFGSSGQATLDLTQSGLAVTVATQAASDNSTKASSTGYADAAVAVEASARSTADGLLIPKTAIVDGTSASASLSKVVATRVLTAQSAVDGAVTTSLYTAPVAGVYRITAGMTVRTKSSSAWVVLASLAPPTGTNLLTITLAQLAMSTGGTTNGQQCTTIVLAVNDIIKVGTTTSSGSNTGGNFDVCWIVERLS